MAVHKRKTNNKWYAQVSYKDIFGKYHKKSSKDFNTKREALDAEVKIKLSLKEHSDPSSSKITFQRAYEEFYEFKKDKVKTTTLMTYPTMWRHFTYKELPIEKLTIPMYQAWKKEMDDKGFQTKWKNKVHSLVNLVVQYARMVYGVRCDVLERCGNFKDANRIRTKNINFYSYEEFQKFIKEMDDLKYKTLFTFLYYEGTRIGEANALTWKDINWKRNTVNIDKTANTKIKGVDFLVTSTKKTASDRVIPLIDDAKTLLLEWQEEQKKYTNYNDDWFVFGGPKPMGESHLHDIKNKAADKAGLKHIRIHDFRHSAAVFYITELNCPATMIQALLGHANLSITLKVYHHILPNQLDVLNSMVNQFKSR